ncbi:MAG: DUF4922 domain-containing protein [Proteiniphilum sp.]|jgi:hypothetical protein|nr:DUF4922 domain-containing protein [Proteiniphilum sp.]
MNLQTEINELFVKQQDEWEQLKKAIEQLDKIREKEFSWGDTFTVRVQFNPARMTSTAAKTDKEAVEKRPCFLCETNRPLLQRGVPFLGKYSILCNPFPILRNHVTIPIHSHVPQRIRNKTGDILTLTEELPDYIVFYNGPKCGASAPDHFHLQAGLKTSLLLQGDNALRSCLTIESENRKETEELFEDVYQYLRHCQPEEEEPMMNVIAFTEENKYKLHLYPRRAHRPRHYYEEGSRQLLISPGALDMAGLIISVREEDFDKIERQDIEEIYSQVSMPVI